MKFTTIFGLFNGIVILSFLFIFLMPIFLLGGDYALSFWQRNWALALAFVVALGALNVFFIGNRRVFALIEKEDWKGLSAHLSEVIFVRHRIRSQYVRLLVSASMLEGNVQAIERLEAELRAKKPALLARHAVRFGSTYLLRGRAEEAEAFLEPYLKAKGAEEAEWLRFDYALALVLQKKTAGALSPLRSLCQAKDKAVRALAAYFLDSVAGTEAQAERESDRKLSQDTAKAIKARWKAKAWAADLERAKNEVHVVILVRLLDDATRWLYGKEGEAAT